MSPTVRSTWAAAVDLPLSCCVCVLLLSPMGRLFGLAFTQQPMQPTQSIASIHHHCIYIPSLHLQSLSHDKLPCLACHCFPPTFSPSHPPLLLCIQAIPKIYVCIQKRETCVATPIQSRIHMTTESLDISTYATQISSLSLTPSYSPVTHTHTSTIGSRGPPASPAIFGWSGVSVSLDILI